MTAFLLSSQSNSEATGDLDHSKPANPYRAIVYQICCQ